MAAGIAVLGLVGVWQLHMTAPAPSETYRAWRSAHPEAAPGAALFAFGDFGALDLDTLETTAMPWAVLATALALAETQGDADRVEQRHIAVAFKRFGFLYPSAIQDHPDLGPTKEVPLGFSIGPVERTLPPLRVTTINIGCASCHAGPAYRSDGTPNPETAVLGRPNAALNLEAFTVEGYAALKRALSNEDAFDRAMRRLFPDMTLRERLTLKFIALPAAQRRMAELSDTIDRPLPFSNGTSGLTNGVGSLKYQLRVSAKDKLSTDTGFVSIPDLGNRHFRSAFLADGAYALKGEVRFRTIAKEEAEGRDLSRIAALASFFMVPSMGLTPDRAQAAIGDLTSVIKFLAGTRPPPFPGPVDMKRAADGRLIYARSCASCHGTYDDALDAPGLISFPNWAGEIGTDGSRSIVFDQDLKAAADKTPHGRGYIDIAVTGVKAAPLLSGVWSSAPYLTNGSVPTLRHLLEPETRPKRFMTGGHRLNFDMVGVDGVLDVRWYVGNAPGLQAVCTTCCHRHDEARLLQSRA